MNPETLRRAVVERLGDTPVVVALGGGADSAVVGWACAMRPGTRAVFVDQGLEGSATLRKAAGRLAEDVGLDLTVIAAPVEDGPNLEARARQARWRAIRQDLAPGEVVVTGHSRDDFAETVLINLLRGAGSRGLAAMAASRRGIIRPLAGSSRAELRQLADRLGLPFADDPANQDLDFLRNRIRRELIPTLERDYQPAAGAILARAGFHLAADDAELEAAAEAVVLRDDGGALLIPIPVLSTIARPVASRVVGRALRRLNPPYGGTTGDIDRVFDVATGGASSATLGGALTASREYPYLAIWAQAPPVPAPVTVVLPGSVPFGSRRIATAPAASTAITPHSTLLLDPAAFTPGLVVRGAGYGDRIDVAAGTKPVREALAEAGVPVRKRAAWPVLADGAKIAAVVGVRVAPWARPAGDPAVAVTGEGL